MKTQITKTIKLAFLMLVTITIFSCSKKDDEPAPTPATESYTVPVEITFNGATNTSSMDVLVPDISINPCKTVWAIAEKKLGKLGFVIGNFNPAGGTIDKIVDPEGCSKMMFEGQVGDLEYYIEENGISKIELVGKTYTLTCKAILKNDPSAPRTFDVKAVWTKP